MSNLCASNGRVPPFVMIENYFGFEESRLLPPNIELIGVIQLPEVFKPISSDIQQ